MVTGIGPARNMGSPDTLRTLLEAAAAAPPTAGAVAAAAAPSADT
jgi:hypothetical protein